MTAVSTDLREAVSVDETIRELLRLWLARDQAGRSDLCSALCDTTCIEAPEIEPLLELAEDWVTHEHAPEGFVLPLTRLLVTGRRAFLDNGVPHQHAFDRSGAA